jgi:hypothetical protein
VLFDVLLVTAVVHVTGRGQSDFSRRSTSWSSRRAPAAALPGGFLVGALAALLYFADAVWGGR